MDELIQIIRSTDMSILLTAGLGPILLALIMGKFLRRLVLRPFEWWASRTENKFDDQLIEDAKDDLNLKDK